MVLRWIPNKYEALRPEKKGQAKASKECVNLINKVIAGCVN